MKRFLIFLFLFPAVATVSFYAVLYVLTGAVVDSLSGPGIMCLVSIGPGLVARRQNAHSCCHRHNPFRLWCSGSVFGLGRAALKTFLRSVLSAQS